MSYNISKELFEEVMKNKIFYSNDFHIDNNIISYVENDTWKDISINDFFFKCKEWAYKQCNEIISYTEGCEIYQTQLDEIVKEFYSDSEQQAVFDACQWILENKEK